MDGNRFDKLTKSMATRQSRRGVLKTIGAGLAAGLAALGIGEAGAVPGNGKGEGKAGGPGARCRWNGHCAAGLVCTNGTCQECPDNYCPLTGTCAPACAGTFDPATCRCECQDTTCCLCLLRPHGEICLGPAAHDAITCESLCLFAAGPDFSESRFFSRPGATFVCPSVGSSLCDVACSEPV